MLIGRHRADPDDTTDEVPLVAPVGIVTWGGDWVIAVENYDTYYEHDATDDDDWRGLRPEPIRYEGEPYGDWCTDCDVYFGTSEDTGRYYCGCGFWYDRWFWGLK